MRIETPLSVTGSACAAGAALRHPDRRQRRQRHPERRPERVAAAVDADGAAVQLDDLADQREPEAQSAVAAARRRIGLPEAIEHVWQELGRDALAGVADGQARRSAPRARARSRIDPPDSVNFIAFDSRFQITCCSRSASPLTAGSSSSNASVDRHLFGRGARRDDVDRPPARPRRSTTGVDLQPQLAADDPRHVEQIFDQAHLRHRVALDDLERVGARTNRRLRPQDARPADHGVQRRANLVRQAWRGIRP